MDVYKRFEKKYTPMEECWVWQAGCSPLGYGRFYAFGKDDYAHRVSYMLYVGPIPKGYDIDHLCRNRACVNPAHLEAVTHQENLLRSPSHIIHGDFKNKQRSMCRRNEHELIDPNIIYQEMPGGRVKRSCKACRNIRQAKPQ